MVTFGSSVMHVQALAMISISRGVKSDLSAIYVTISGCYDKTVRPGHELALAWTRWMDVSGCFEDV